MDTKKIKALLRAIDLGSLSSAAEDLGYTQSGLTHMMNSLEDEFGLSLLIRNKSGVHLSPPGQKLLHDMKALVDASNRLEHSIEAIKEHSFSTLKIGAYSSVARTWLPSILESYKLISPETEFLLSMQDVRTLYEAVKNEELDCAVVSYQKDLMSGLSWTALRDDELVAILPGKYSVEEGSFPVDYFSGMDFLMPSDGFDMDILPIFSKIPPKSLPNFRYTNMDDAAIVSMVTHGLGVSILSRLIMQSVTEEIAVVSLTPKAHRKLGIIVKSRRQSDKSIKSFISTSKSVLNTLP